MYQPTANGYFSGIGGLEIGLMQAGVKVQQSIDLDPEAIGVMKQNPHFFGHDILREDITQKTVLEQPESDIMAFTWPCTKYSPIADIHGTRTGDDLFLHGFRHVVLRRPEMWVLENVPGMRKFKVVMECFTKLPDYYITVFCPLRTDIWLPQKRDRLIVIGTRRPFSISEPTNNRWLTIKHIIDRDAQVRIPDYVKSRMKGNYRDKPIIVDADDPNAIAPTCVAHYAKDMGTRMVKIGKLIRPFSVREYARLQGFPDDMHFEEKNSSYRLIGNAVPPPMGRWMGQQAVRYFN